MKFTVYTPFYNYIDAADAIFYSLINQTYSNWEWVILDDFSENEEVLNKLKDLEKLDERVKIIYPEYKNQYLFNLPVKYCSGEIILSLDSDDIPYPKLLEVYKNIFRKFPNLASLSCSSLIRNGDFRGPITAAKYTNYLNSSNYIEASNNGVKSILGDARSYRISKLPKDGIFIEKILEDFICVDVQKALTVEETGELMVIPRVLHEYSMRADSMSGYINYQKNKDFIDQSLKDLFSDALRRFDRNTLVSINNYFDHSFNKFKNFFFTEMDKDGKSKIIEYWDNRIGARDRKIINELMFDHKINYNCVIEKPNVIIISIENESDLSLIDKLKDRNLAKCKITISSNKNLSDIIFEKVKNAGYSYWFNIFYYLTICIDIE
jgi:glycosyltransferase involved in cell wall biosynthesis